MITTLKTKSSGDYVYPNIQSQNIPVGAVTTEKVMQDAITSEKIKIESEAFNYPSLSTLQGMQDEFLNILVNRKGFLYFYFYVPATYEYSKLEVEYIGQLEVFLKLGSTRYEIRSSEDAATFYNNFIAPGYIFLRVIEEE